MRRVVGGAAVIVCGSVHRPSVESNEQRMRMMTLRQCCLLIYIMFGVSVCRVGEGRERMKGKKKKKKKVN